MTCPQPPEQWDRIPTCAMADGPEEHGHYSADERVWFDRVRPEGGVRCVPLHAGDCDGQPDLTGGATSRASHPHPHEDTAGTLAMVAYVVGAVVVLVGVAALG